MSDERNAKHGQILDGSTLRMERILPGPIERVWAFLTESEKRKRWFAEGEFELRVGGATNLLFDHRNLSHEETPEKFRQFQGYRSTGKVLACEPPRRLTITWQDDGSEVGFELSPEGDQVKLVLTHRKLREDVKGTAAGWHAHLGILEDLLAERKPRGFWSFHESLERDYADRLRVMEGYFQWSAGVGREVRSQGQTWSSLLRRRLDASIDRVWAAWTDPAKIPLWFGKPAGDFRVGGTVVLDLYQPQKTTVNILACEPPRRLRTTWKYGDMAGSEVELRLAPEGDGTLLELEHFLAPSRDDARGTGSGWEVALLHLDHWLRDLPRPNDVMHPAMDEVWTRVEAP